MQGVGYRAWLAAAADELKVDGWVRNCTDGCVEAAFGGPPGAVAEMLARSKAGPKSARVDVVEITEEGFEVDLGFSVAPTV